MNDAEEKEIRNEEFFFRIGKERKEKSVR